VLYAVPLVVSYLLGSISFSVLMVRILKGIDVRQHGSGNAGATNTLRLLGWGPAILVFALDIFKGTAAVWLGSALAPDGDVWLPVFCGLLVIAGHNWPIFFGFKGGKGIATTIGVTAFLFFLPALYAGIIGLAAVVITRYVSLGSLLFTGLLPVSLALTDYPKPFLWMSLLIMIFAWYRHRTNIVKLLKGQENKIGSKKNK
jgi:glycerol-3-phosphate acyltransferase PlsY